MWALSAAFSVPVCIVLFPPSLGSSTAVLLLAVPVGTSIPCTRSNLAVLALGSATADAGFLLLAIFPPLAMNQPP